MSLKVLEKAECEALGMGLFLGVAEASAEPPKFIHLTYTPKGMHAVRSRGSAQPDGGQSNVECEL
jgi:leucyl aminopeptidase